VEEEDTEDREDAKEILDLVELKDAMAREVSEVKTDSARRINAKLTRKLETVGKFLVN